MESKLTKKEIESLIELARGSYSVSDLAKKVGGEQRWISIILKDLAEKGFVNIHRTGKAKEVELTAAKHTALFWDLVTKEEHISWQELLSHSSIPILFSILDGQRETDDIQRETGLSLTSIWRWMRKFGSYGIILSSEGRYKINPRHNLLISFLREYRLYMLTKFAKEVSSEAVLLWQRDFESLIRMPLNTETNDKRFHLTAVSRFGEIGIPIILNYDYYFYSERKERLRNEDLILHTLLIDRESPRYALYALLAIKKLEGGLDKPYLFARSARYDLERQLRGMFRFLNEKKKIEGVILPSWQEFRERAKDYGVV